jgi:hypothetical protein
MHLVADLLPMSVLQHYLIYQKVPRSIPCSSALVDHFLCGSSWTLEEFSTRILGFTYSQLRAEREREYASYCANAGLSNAATPPEVFYGAPHPDSFFVKPSAGLVKGWVQGADEVRAVCAAHMNEYTCDTVPFHPTFAKVLVTDQ